MASHLLHHDASVLLTNDAGLDCIATAHKVFLELQQEQQLQHQNGGATMAEWNDFIHELRRREGVEKAKMEARDRARSQANDEYVWLIISSFLFIVDAHCIHLLTQPWEMHVLIPHTHIRMASCFTH